MTGRELAEEGGAAPPLPTSVGLPTYYTHHTYYIYYILHILDILDILHTTSYKCRPPHILHTPPLCEKFVRPTLLQD